MESGEPAASQVKTIREIRKWIARARFVLVFLKALAPRPLRVLLELIDTLLDTVDGFLDAVETAIQRGEILWTF